MGQPASQISVTVAEMVSEAREPSLEEIPPLAEVVDPDALDALVPATADDPPPDVTVTFSYAGLRVVVRSGEMVYIRPRGGDGDDSVGRTPGDE